MQLSTLPPASLIHVPVTSTPYPISLGVQASLVMIRRAPACMRLTMLAPNNLILLALFLSLNCSGDNDMQGVGFLA